MSFLGKYKNGGRGWKKHCISPLPTAVSKYWRPVLHNESFFSLQLPQPRGAVGPAVSTQESETHGDKRLGAEGSHLAVVETQLCCLGFTGVVSCGGGRLIGHRLGHTQDLSAAFVGSLGHMFS